jgi:Protein of unknown function (DUF2612)
MTTPTGPDYPHDPVAGSNAIGSLTVGKSQIGDIPIFDIWATIESQYANSPVLTTLLELWFQSLDQTGNLQAFEENIWNVDTAYGYGLDVWGRIVGITRTIQVLNPLPCFGFEESGTAYGFNQAMFYTGEPFTQNYILGDQDYRRLILAKARSNITNDSIPQFNNILMNLFYQRGNCWVEDNAWNVDTSYFAFEESGSGFGFNQAPFYDGGGAGATMGMTYVFTFPLSSIDVGIVNSGVLPRPAGVPAAIRIIEPEFI